MSCSTGVSPAPVCSGTSETPVLHESDIPV